MPWTNIGARVSSGEQTRLWCCLEEGGGTRVSLWSHEMGLAVWAGLPKGLCCLRHPGDLKPGHFRSSYQFPVAAAIYNQQLGCLKFKSKYFFSLSLEVRRLRVRFRRSILLGSGEDPFPAVSWLLAAAGDPWRPSAFRWVIPIFASTSRPCPMTVCPSLSLVRTLSLNAGPPLIQCDLQRPYLQTRP